MKKISFLISFLLFFTISCLASILNITTQEYAFLVITLFVVMCVTILLIISLFVIFKSKEKESSFKELKNLIEKNRGSIIQELVLIISLIIIFNIIVTFTSVNNLVAYEITWFIASVICTILRCKKIDVGSKI